MLRVILFLCLCLGATSSLAQSPKTTSLQQAHQVLLDDPGYQFEMATPPAPRPPPQWALHLGRFFKSIAPVLNWVFRIGLAILVLGFLVLVLREIVNIRFRLTGSKTKIEPPVTNVRQPDAKTARALLMEADRLASQGKFAQAVHHLLFRSIQDIETHLPGVIKGSQTSREIEMLQAIPAHPRAGFERIRQAVEQSYFGEMVLAKPHYLQCRTAYEDFAFSPEWS